MPKPKQADLLQGYTWDAEIGRYRYKNGQFVARTKILDLLDTSLERRERRMVAGVQALKDGDVAQRVFVERNKLLLKRQYLQQAAVARGGWDKVTPEDKSRIGGYLTHEYRRMTQMSLDISSGKASVAQGQNRMTMYLGNARRIYYAAEAQSLSPRHGMQIIERRLLGRAEHCFPAGTRIKTPGGEVPIEAVMVGDSVVTSKGVHTVTRLFRRQYIGPLVRLTTAFGELSCTPNHPILTDSGWVRADQLLVGQKVMGLENADETVFGHIGFPDSNNRITASCKIGVSGLISGLLSKLPFYKWLKSRVSMPPIPIRFDYQSISDNGVNDEVGFNKEVSFKTNPDLIKPGEHSLFEFGWVRFLQPLISLSNGGGQFRPILSSLFNKSLSGPRKPRRIVFCKELLSRRVNSLSKLFFGKDYAHSVCLALDNFARNPKLIRQQVGAFAGESDADFVKLLSSPVTLVRVMFLAIRRFAIALESAFGTGLERVFNWRTCFTQLPVPICAMAAYRTGFFESCLEASDINGSAMSGTELLLGELGNKVISTDSAMFSDFRIRFAHALSPNSVPLPLLCYDLSEKTTCMVYNLEVEAVHEYVANGIVVHNCNDCLTYAGMGWQPLGILPPPSVGSVCDGNCRCSIERQEVSMADAAVYLKGMVVEIPPETEQTIPAGEQPVLPMLDDMLPMIEGATLHGIINLVEGGPGSGNHGHRGIPGTRGGSLPSGGGMTRDVVKTYVFEPAKVFSYENGAWRPIKSGEVIVERLNAAMRATEREENAAPEDKAQYAAYAKRAWRDVRPYAIEPLEKPELLQQVRDMRLRYKLDKAGQSPASGTGQVESHTTETTGSSSSTSLTKLVGTPPSESKPLGGGVNASVAVTWKDGTKAVFKTDSLNNKIAAEVIAYRLAQKLGMNNMPETVMGTLDGKVGSLQKWVSNASEATNIRAAASKALFGSDEQMRAAAKTSVLDIIIGNADRHPGNYMIDKQGKMWAIDHGLAGLKGRPRYERYSDAERIQALNKGFGREDLINKPTTAQAARWSQIVAEEVRNASKLTRADYQEIAHGFARRDVNIFLLMSRAEQLQREYQLIEAVIINLGGQE